MPDVLQWQPAPDPRWLSRRLSPPNCGWYVGVCLSVRPPRSLAWEAHSLSVLTEGRFEMGIGTGRPGIEDEVRQLGLPVVTPGRAVVQVRDAVTSLRDLDGPDLHTPVVMAVARSEVPGAGGRPCRYSHVRGDAGDDSRDGILRMAAISARFETSNSRSTCRWSATPSPRFMAPPDTDPAALRAVDSLLVLPQ